jgi:hypothetical protein
MDKYCLQRCERMFIFAIEFLGDQILELLLNWSVGQTAKEITMNADILDSIAKSYCKLLNSIDWNDKYLVLGLREGLNKFLSNVYLKTHDNSKYFQGDFYTKLSLNKIEENDFNGLIYEHMVPKSKYIQKVCEDKAHIGELSLDIIVNLLEKFWKIAVITQEEDKKLLSRSMPKN